MASQQTERTDRRTDKRRTLMNRDWVTLLLTAVEEMFDFMKTKRMTRESNS